MQKIIMALTMDDVSIKLIGKEGRKNVKNKFNVENVFFYLFRV